MFLLATNFVKNNHIWSRTFLIFLKNVLNQILDSYLSDLFTDVDIWY